MVISIDNNKGYYLPVGHQNHGTLSYQPPNLPATEVKTLLENIFMVKPVNYHNMPYDQLTLEKTLGMPLQETAGDDTMIMAHLWNENHRKSLKELARTLLPDVANDKTKLDPGLDDKLHTMLLDEYEYEATAKNGRKYKKRGFKLKPNWQQRVLDYHNSISGGAVSYDYMIAFTQKLFSVLKKAGVMDYDKNITKSDFHLVPAWLATQYAIDDGFNTNEVAGFFKNIHLDLNPELKTLYRDIELPVNQVMTAATLRGIKVDKHHLVQMRKLCEERLKDLRTECLDIAKLIIPPAQHEDFNFDTLLSSSDQLGKLLFDIVGYKAVTYTKGGKPSTDADTIEELLQSEPKNTHLQPWAEQFLESRQKLANLTKIKSTYTDSIIDKLDPAGRLHAFFNTVKAVSGRMSSSEPNVQNIPRLTDEEREESPWLEGIDIRKAFVADDGYVFCCADYQSMEMIPTAAFSNDEGLKTILRDKRDMHCYTARKTFGVDPGDLMTDKDFKNTYKLERQQAKMVNFLMAYMGTVWTIMNRLKVDRPTAQKLYDGYFKTFPGLKRYMNEKMEELKLNGYVTYPDFGFRKHMDMPDKKLQHYDKRQYDRQLEAAVRTCFNALGQGWSAYVVKEAIVNIDKELRAAGLTPDDAQIVMQVHDEIIVLHKLKHARVVHDIMHKVMPRKVIDVDLEIDLDFKFSLSKAEKGLSLSDIEALALVS